MNKSKQAFKWALFVCLVGKVESRGLELFRIIAILHLFVLLLVGRTRLEEVWLAGLHLRFLEIKKLEKLTTKQNVVKLLATYGIFRMFLCSKTSRFVFLQFWFRLPLDEARFCITAWLGDCSTFVEKL